MECMESVVAGMMVGCADVEVGAGAGVQEQHTGTSALVRAFKPEPLIAIQ